MHDKGYNITVVFSLAVILHLEQIPLYSSQNNKIHNFNSLK